MSLITYPLNNVMYSAEDAELFHATRTSGIFAENSFEISVNGADNSVTIGPGIGWIKNGEFSGKVIALKEAVTIDLGIPDSVYPRIDAVVIQFDSANNETNVVAKKGTASSSPIAPEVVQNENVYELHLLHARRSVGALVVSFSDITDLRLNPAYCGLMADSVTQIDTSAINNQVNSLISDLRNEIESVEDESAFWLKNDVIPVSSGGTNNGALANAEDGVYIVKKTSPHGDAYLGYLTGQQVMNALGAVNKAGDTMSGDLTVTVSGASSQLIAKSKSGQTARIAFESADDCKGSLYASTYGNIVLKDVTNNISLLEYNVSDRRFNQVNGGYKEGNVSAIAKVSVTSYTLQKNAFANVCFLQLAMKSTEALSAGSAVSVAAVGSEFIPGRIQALSCYAPTGAIDASINTSGNIRLRPSSDINADAYIYVQGFWFL